MSDQWICTPREARAASGTRMDALDFVYSQISGYLTGCKEMPKKLRLDFNTGNLRIESVIDTIIKRYQQAGWDVRLEGNMLVFNPHCDSSNGQTREK